MEGWYKERYGARGGRATKRTDRDETQWFKKRLLCELELQDSTLKQSVDWRRGVSCDLLSFHDSHRYTSNAYETVTTAAVDPVDN